MAKQTAASPVREPDDTDTLLIELASTVLGDHFFDPDREQEYKALLSTSKPSADTSVLLEEYTVDLTEGECVVRLEALKAWTNFRVAFTGEGFNTVMEGTWSFEREELRPAAVVSRTGDAALIENAAVDLMEELDGPDLDEDEVENMLEMLDDDLDEPDIGDDPKEPPPATGLERNRVKAIAKRIARMAEPELGEEDRSWLEQMPQTLPLITENLIAAASAKRRDDQLVLGYLQMLSLQLMCVRYRQDRGWDWASHMLEEFQQRLIALGEAKTIPQDDWFAMASALNEARVPVSDEVQTKLAEAGFTAADQDLGTPEEMLDTLRGFLDEMADMVKTPFEVMEAIESSAVLMPANLRSFITVELSLSPHAVLRDAVPMSLLDSEQSVRRDAAGALEQTASPGSLSPDTLRRTIAMRNWIPPVDRPAIDSVIRKARLAGVETGAWPRAVDGIEFYATMVDGSGAQSILALSRSGKKGLFSGLLLRHGTGVVDAWLDDDLPRGKISRLLKEAMLGAIFTRVDKPYVDLLVQHALAAGVAAETLPPQGLLQIAERVGGAEWQDRGLDLAANIERLFQDLDEGDRTPDGIEALYDRGLRWMKDDPILSSWYEDGPEVRAALTSVPGGNRAMVDVALNTVLEPNRMVWAERFLLMAMWCQASQEKKYRDRAPELIAVTHALAGDGPLASIPVMALIALQTVREVKEGSW